MPFLYMESSPQLRGRARQYGRQYRKMAVVEVEPGYGPDRIPKMISARARGVVRVVDCATLHVGTTDRSAGRVWRSRMLALVAQLNAAESETLHGPACRRPSCTGRGTVMGWASGWQAAVPTTGPTAQALGAGRGEGEGPGWGEVRNILAGITPRRWISSGTWEAALYCDQCDRQIETLHGERSEFLHGVEVDALRAADWDDLPEETAI